MQVGSELDVHLKVLLGGAVILRGGAGRPSLVGRRCLVKYSPRSRPVPGRAVEAPKKKAGKKAPATGACRRLLRRLYIVNAA